MIYNSNLDIDKLLGGSIILDGQLCIVRKENGYNTNLMRGYILFKVSPPKIDGGLFLLFLVDPLSQD